MSFGKLTNADKQISKIRDGLPAEGEHLIQILSVKDTDYGAFEMRCATVPGPKGGDQIAFRLNQFYTTEKSRAFTIRLFNSLGFPIQDNGTVNDSDVEGIHHAKITHWIKSVEHDDGSSTEYTNVNARFLFDS